MEPSNEFVMFSQVTPDYSVTVLGKIENNMLILECTDEGHFGRDYSEVIKSRIVYEFDEENTKKLVELLSDNKLSLKENLIKSYGRSDGIIDLIEVCSKEQVKFALTIS